MVTSAACVANVPASSAAPMAQRSDAVLDDMEISSNAAWGSFRRGVIERIHFPGGACTARPYEGCRRFHADAASSAPSSASIHVDSAGAATPGVFTATALTVRFWLALDGALVDEPA